MFKRRKSYFYKSFIRFLKMLSVPLLVILLIFGYADGVVRDQILRSASESLNNSAKRFDATIEEMRDACFNIMSRKECRRYVTYAVNMPEETYEVAADLTKLLREYAQEKYYDVFVYYYGDNKIISGKNSSLEAEYYYDAYYANAAGAEFKDEFLDVIKCGSTKPHWYVMDGSGQTPYLCVAMSVEGREESSDNHTICLVLQPDHLKNLLTVDGMEANGTLIVYDQDRELLVAGDRQISEEGHTVCIQKAQSMEGYYGYAALEGVFWRVLVRLRIYCIIGIILSILIGIVMAYRSTVKSYRPVSDLVDFLKEKYGVAFDRKNETEFGYIMSFLQSNERKRKEDENLRREWFLVKILEGKSDLAGKDREYFARNGMDLVGDNYCVCIVDAQLFRDDEDELNSFVIRNIFQELLGRGGTGYAVSVDKNRHVFVAELTGDRESFQEIIREGELFLKEHYQAQVTVGYSEIHDDILEIQEAYQEAKEDISSVNAVLQEGEKADINEDVVSRARRYIEDYYNNPQLSVNMLGEKMKIQGAYLSRLFRERYEISILDYVASVRINRAKQIIAGGEFSVQEIAEQVGFLSSHVFIRTFKKKEGITPGKYKELLGDHKEEQNGLEAIAGDHRQEI